MKVKPDLSFWKLWNISFGFFGVQIAYALQSANISRIFATLGADPHSLSYFWILPPLAGIIVQPIIGAASDKTWTRFGRRIPYLFAGSLLAVWVMCLLPNAGSFGMAVGTAMIFGLVALMFLDTSINMAMQPFKMLVGDMVNEKQKGLAYSIQSFLCNAGSLMGYLFPFIFTFIGISNTADKGTVPDSVIYSFYIGAAILILCVIYTTVKVKEMPPKEFEEFHGITADEKKEKADFISLLKHAPKVFWTVGLVQFFLLGRLHVHVDLHQRCHCRHGVGHYGRPKRRLSGSGQLGRRAVRRAGHRISHLGCDIAIVQGPQTGLCPEPRTGWHRFHIHPILPQRISAVHLLSADRLCLGRHACHAVHYPDQFGFGQKHGGLPGTVQRNHLCTANRRRPCRRRTAPPRRGASGEHAGAGRRTADCRCRLCIFHQRDDGASRSVKVYCGKTKSAP